ncbi:hypothetical protein LCGC14_3114570 [marine sediment metagenome]|uniref:Uncharacterized protein n=1 Tax=marine sediment metagenome TaxID=412755 RepID=A0A0F8WT33_9ZZZZ
MEGSKDVDSVMADIRISLKKALELSGQPSTSPQTIEVTVDLTDIVKVEDGYLVITNCEELLCRMRESVERSVHGN